MQNRCSPLAYGNLPIKTFCAEGLCITDLGHHLSVILILSHYFTLSYALFLMSSPNSALISIWMLALHFLVV